MSDPGWRRLEALFHELIELPEEDAALRLAQIEAGDPELAERLRSLLGAAQETTRIGEMIGGAAVDVARALEGIPPGTLLGPYRVVEEIARGGMGVVYLAQRDDGHFDQRVAIKVLGSAALTPDAARRFRSERRILAQLEHPNIARLLDGGATAQGLPYLVMEYVDGVSIRDYCREKRLDVRSRLALFRTLCDAVQAAHQRLIVHRDIKPSNILVTADGTPKLLDFGIAKLLEPGATTHTVIETVAQNRLLTPEYASPEQLRGDVVTTASDVYALGVVLYELLVGRSPYELPSRQPEAVERVVCTTTPEAPSRAKAVPDRGVARRDLSRDLDTIVLTAMRKEPERRYAGAAQLADDVRRYLESRPITARRDTLPYVLNRFVLRNRAAVAMAALGFAITVGTGAFFTWRLAEQRDLAQRERDTAQQVSEFMVDIFEAADPYGARRGDVSAREVLEAAEARIDRELQDAPVLRSTLLQSMGDAYRGLGDWNAAAALLQKAVDAARSAPGAGDLQLAESLAALGSTQERLGRNQHAESAFKEASALLAERLGPMHPDTLDVFNAIGGALRRQGRFDEAIAYHEESLRRSAQLEDDPEAEYGNALMSTGMTYYAMADFERAEDHLRRALSISREQLHENHEQIYTSMAMLGLVLHKQGDNAMAEAIYDEVIERQLAALGPAHPMMGRAYRNLAEIVAARGDATRAEALLESAIEVFTNALGREARDVAAVRLRLAQLYETEARQALAVDNYREALAIASGAAAADRRIAETARAALSTLASNEEE